MIRPSVFGCLGLGEDPIRLRGASRILGLAAALALASYAQYAIARPLPGWMSPLSRLDDELVRIYGRPQSVLLAFVFFVVAGVAFVATTRAGRNSVAPERWPAYNPAALWRGVWGRLSMGLFLGGLILWSYVVARLWSGHYEESYPLLFGLSLVGLSAPFVRWDISAGLRPRFGFRWWEPLFVAALAATFFVLNVRDLDNWRYSYIGDEFAFFDTAQLIRDGQTFNLFSQAGPYGYHPFATSAYQAMVMKVFGFDYFGWKMGSLLAVVATIPAFYALVRLAFGVRPAIYSTVFLSASHYLFAYAHTGYNNVLALFPLVGAFALFFLGWRRGSSFALFAAGCFGALGFYNFFSARVAIVILALFVLTMGLRWRRPTFAGPVAVGFALVVLPIFAADNVDVITAMLDSSATGSADPLGKQVLENLPRSLFAFNYSPHQGHYLAGALMDAPSAVLAVLGLSYSLFMLRSRPHRFLIIWYAVALIATGLFFIEDRVPFTRTQIVLPAMAAFAGIAVDRILMVLEDMSPWERFRPFATSLSLVVLVPLVFTVNVQRFWDDSAHAAGSHPMTLSVRAVMDGPCEGNGPTNAVVSVDLTHWLELIFRVYGLGDERPALWTYGEVSAETLADARCVILIDPQLPAAGALLAELRENQPSRPLEELSDLANISRVLVVGPPAPD